MKKIFAVLLFLISISSFSEDNLLDEYRYTVNGIILGQQNVSFLSPLYYNSYSLTTTRGHVCLSDKKLSIFEFNDNFGFDFNNSSASILYSLGFDLNYSKYYLLNVKGYPASFPDVYLGWSYMLDTDFFLKISNTNNPFYYNFNNLACLGIYCEKKFQKIKISDELRFSVFGVFSGSEYSSSLPYFLTEEDGGFFQAFDIGSFGTETFISNKLNVDFKMNTSKGLRTFRFQYAIESSKLTLNENVRHYTFHVFKIGYLFNILEYEK